jgi:hypothetical protein
MTPMTHLNPQTAPWLHIQPLPKGYRLASGDYHQSDRIERVRITTWMPDAFGDCEIPEDSVDPEEDFLEDHCRSCDYYFDEEDGDADGMTDNSGNYIYSCRVTSKCPCYESGLSAVTFPCEEGYDGPDYNEGDYFRLPPMAFAIDLTPRKLCPSTVSAWVQDIRQDHTGAWLCTERYRGINIHEADEAVCWGNDNSTPSSLPEAVATYSDAPANEDLLSVSGFKRNITLVRQATAQHPINGLLVGPGYDALLVANATATPSAFLLLSASGISSANGLIVLGLTSCTHTFADGTTVAGYLTDPVINGRSWLLINNPAALEEGGEAFDSQGLLLGQIQSTTSTTSPCDSPAPSSLAPAELAAY